MGNARILISPGRPDGGGNPARPSRGRPRLFRHQHLPDGLRGVQAGRPPRPENHGVRGTPTAARAGAACSGASSTAFSACGTGKKSRPCWRQGGWVWNATAAPRFPADSVFEWGYFTESAASAAGAETPPAHHRLHGLPVRGTTACTPRTGAGPERLGCATDILTVEDRAGSPAEEESSFIRAVPNDLCTPLGISMNLRRRLGAWRDYDLYHTNGLWLDVNHATCAQARKTRKPCVASPPTAGAGHQAVEEKAHAGAGPPPGPGAGGLPSRHLPGGSAAPARTGLCQPRGGHPHPGGRAFMDWPDPAERGRAFPRRVPGPFPPH